MADIKISELTQVSALNNGDLVEVSQVNALAPSGYTSLKASMTDLGKKVNSDIDYTTELADFTDKTTLGAIKETAKGKNVADEYDGTQTYDKGDVVIYKNTLYICTTNNTTGTFDPSKWTATTIDNVIGSLSSLTTTDKSSIVGAVNEVNNRLGNRLVGAWTADTSTANVQILTDDIDVTVGTYLIIMTYPDTSANFVACLYNHTTNSVYDNCYMSGGSWTSKAIVTAFSGNGKMCIASAQGASCNFTNKNRGSIRAIKLSNVY